MKFFYTILLSLLFIQISFSNEIEPRIMESRSMYSKILGQEVKYSVCLPEDYFKGNRKYPVVYLLHGLGDDETAWLEYGRITQIADKAVKEKAIIPMIFVIPQGYRTYYVNDYASTFMYQDMFIQELIPFIDSQYLTIADKQHRATVGCSMGGFGALILPLKNPDVINTCVPLSISIRTDKQYMVEDASEWDKQWGSLFGGVGKTGEDRITKYYKQNCPFHILSQNDLSKYKELKIYIDNGDEEKTLCRSNEELHILLSDKGFPHEFRVRDGGHSFSYWRDALSNGLRYISDAFESKPYRGDIKINLTKTKLTDKQFQNIALMNQQFYVYYPTEYDCSNRLFPVVYFAGNFTTSQCKSIAELFNQEINNNNTCPMLIVFLQGKVVNTLKEILPELREKLRLRDNYRLQILVGFQNEALDVCNVAIKQEQFTACIISDAFLNNDSISNLLTSMNPEAIKRTSFFIDAPDNGKFYAGNGNAHMILRDKELQHEYRVREGDGGFDWFLEGLPEIISFTSKRFHK